MSSRRYALRRAGKRTAAVLGALTLLGGLLSACGGNADSGAKTVAIEHKFGTTRVPADVDRVATVGWNDQEFVLALGIEPVTTRAWFDAYDNFPWVKQATDGEGVKKWSADGINFEAVANSKPDVIFAIYESFDRKTYDRLSKIAPTVVQSSDYADEETPWDVQLMTTGKALGMSARAGAMVDRVRAKIAATKRANPGFAGKTLVVDFGPEDGGHYLIGKGDPRRTLFDALGFDTQSAEGDVSEEKLSLLDRDVLFVVGATKSQLASSPAFARLGVVREDRTLYTTFESNLGGALSYSGPQAILYALDKLVPQLANAVAGRPVADLANA